MYTLTKIGAKIKIAFLPFALLFYCGISKVYAQSPGCANADFSMKNFTNWTGNTSIYPYNTPGSNVSSSGIPYYMTPGIVPGRQTIITTSTPDPFTCGNVMTLPPGEKQCVRLGNGGVNPTPGNPAGWTNGVGYQRDYLSYVFSITSKNSLLIYKYAVVLQDPTNDPVNPPHPKPIKPRFVVTIKNATGGLIDTVCGKKEDFADTNAVGYRSCTLAGAQALGGNAAAGGDIMYRAWTTVGVDLRKYIGTNVTIQFETWDCGLGAHFGYAYITAKCDTMAIITETCTPDGSVKLTAPEGFSYKWLPGGQTSRSINLFGVQPGDSAHVELTTLDGCKTSLNTVIYPTIAKARFTLKPNIVCLGNPIAFTDSSSSIYTWNNSLVPIKNRKWMFDDGDSSLVTNPTHIYNKSGTFNISLSIEDTSGCKDNVSHTVQVLPAPVADFTFLEACENKDVSFTDMSQVIGVNGSIATWTWTFSDNNTTSPLQNPTHLYNKAGTYNITLNIKTDKGCVDDTVKTIKIWPNPTALFTATSACAGSPINFTDLSTVRDTADGLSSWIWNFGDLSNLSSIKNPSHTYAKDGTYFASVIINTSRKCVADTVLPIIVYSQPIANFSATPICLDTPVQFTDLPLPSGDIVSWKWSFDDPNNDSSNIQNPTHMYDTSRVYFPTLTVVSSHGCSSSASQSINIPPLPEANLDANKYEGCYPLCVNFIDLTYSSIDTVMNWNWNFGDNTTSTLQNPPHCYPNPGVYTVSLSVETRNSCKSSFTWKDMIRVFPHPVAAFSLTPTETTESDGMVIFTDQSTGADFWLWNYDDNEISTLKDTSHLYTKAGTYNIWLHVKNVHDCVDSVEHQLIVNPEWGYYVPNAFSPNGDGRNDFFIGKGFNYTDFRMWIFDRWGNMIYFTDDDTKPWNGKVNNGINNEQTAQEDVYVYKIKLKDVFGKAHQYNGAFSLIK